MFEEMVRKNNPYSKIIGKYTGMDNKVECECLICGKRYFAKAYDVKIGKKHRECSFVIGTQKRTKTQSEFINQVSEVHRNVKIIGQYKNAKEKIECLCVTHNETFYSDPDHLLSGKCGCKSCRSEKISSALSKSHDEFANVTNQIEILGKYNGLHSSVQVKCKKCGYIWSPTAYSLLAGNGCPHCVGRNKTTEEYKDEIYKYNKDIEIIGKYIDTNHKILCKCKMCNREWMANPNSLKRTGCPWCRQSHGEKAIRQYLDEHNIAFIPQKTFDGLVGVGGRNLSYDYYISDMNILIEYQGEFHDGTARQQSKEDYEKQIEHDKRKKEYANINGYKLIEIWYWDFNKINEILERELC